MADLRRPHALLLDFGGVIAENTARDDWADVLAREVHQHLLACHVAGLEVAEVREDIVDGVAAVGQWKRAACRLPAPRELTYREYWTDFIGADWPEAAREFVRAHASELCRRMSELTLHRRLRDGMLDLLSDADARGIPVAVVSNGMSGTGRREWMRGAGLEHRFAVEVYSDEVGVTKPNPEMIWIATRTLGADPRDCWYVGDRFDRDVLCGRRARVGGNILMEARSTYTRPHREREMPDAVVADPQGLRDLLSATAA